MQCTYHVISRCVRETIVVVKQQLNIAYSRVCACTRSCARARVFMCVGVGGCSDMWACACGCTRVAFPIQHAKCKRHASLPLVASQFSPNVSTLPDTRHNLRKNADEHKTCFNFLYKFYPKHFSLLEEVDGISS
jgi:hypothetical protein